jgi:hypothetical protein
MGTILQDLSTIIFEAVVKNSVVKIEKSSYLCPKYV